MAGEQAEPVAPVHEGLQPLSQQKNLNAHQTAPPELKAFFKRYSSPFPEEPDEIIDFGSEEASLPGFESISTEQVDKAFAPLRSNGGGLSTGWEEAITYMNQKDSPREAFSFKKIPGKIILLVMLL